MFVRNPDGTPLSVTHPWVCTSEYTLLNHLITKPLRPSKVQLAGVNFDTVRLYNTEPDHQCEKVESTYPSVLQFILSKRRRAAIQASPSWTQAAPTPPEKHNKEHRTPVSIRKTDVSPEYEANQASLSGKKVVLCTTSLIRWEDAAASGARH